MSHQWSVALNTAATSEPVTLAEAKEFLRVGHGDDDTAITNLIIAARQQVESFTNRQLVDATWDLYIDEFHGASRILFPKPPLSSVTTFTYLDTAGSSQTWTSTNWILNTVALPGEMKEAFGISWPTVRQQYNAVVITYVAGYGSTAASVPEEIKNAMHLIIAKQYDDPENKTLDSAVESLLSDYKTWYDVPWR